MGPQAYKLHSFVIMRSAIIFTLSISVIFLGGIFFIFQEAISIPLFLIGVCGLAIADFVKTNTPKPTTLDGKFKSFYHE